MKPCIRENKPDHIIILVSINNLNSEIAPERIAKSIVDIHQSRKSFSYDIWNCTA